MQSEETSEVLEIGGGPMPQAAQIYPKAKIVTMDIDQQYNPDYVGDATSLPFPDERFDGILASHILEHISYWQEQLVIVEWARCLKPGGILHVIVPSWEWVARNVLAENPSPALKPTAFAGHISPWDVHLNMFTMRQLRALFDRAGLLVIKARTGMRMIHVGTVGDFPSEQHYIAGMKPEKEGQDGNEEES